MDGVSLIASNHNKVYVTHQELEKMQIKIQCMVLLRMMTKDDLYQRTYFKGYDWKKHMAEYLGDNVGQKI